MGFVPCKGDFPLSITRSFVVAAFVASLGLTLPSSTSAQAGGPAKPAAPQETKKDEAKKDAPKKEEVKRDDRSEDFDRFIKDLKRIDGAMPMYQKGSSIYLELPEDKVGKVFFFQAAFNTGLDNMSLHPGMEIGDMAVDAYRFERHDDILWLVRPNISNRWSKEDPFHVGADRAFPEAILTTFKIEQQEIEKKKLLVNITSLFYGETVHLSELVQASLGGPYMLDMAKSGPDKISGYPENMSVQMKLHFMAPRAGMGGGMEQALAALMGGSTNTLEDNRSAPVRVSYSISWRKDNGYVARKGDPRVGFFDVSFWSLDRFFEKDKNENYITRWDLRKKDPTAKISEPVKPIIWTIDTTIPEKYRPAIKDGVLRWNKAFEALGYKDAIRVQDAPKDEAYDHADGRYNVIRFMSGPSAPFAAISLPRVDPFTGEILSASITIDANVLQTLAEEHSREILPSLKDASLRANSVLLRNADRKETDDWFLFATPEQKATKAAEERLTKFGWTHADCDYVSELAEGATNSWYALLAAPGGATISRDDYINRYLAECVMHEMGHCLGLRHNFAGSTNLTTAQLADDGITSQQGISASVMDYTPANVQAVLRGRGVIYQNTIGAYDQWAIQYGYQGFGAKTPTDERYALSQIASQSGAPGHAFMTDEDADGYNPYAVRFDCAKDPLAFSAQQLVALKRARNYAIANLPKKGESYGTRTQAILSSIAWSFREGRIAARFIGGIAGSRNFRGDVNERPTLMPVDVETQRQAVHLIVANFFSPNAFNLPPSVMESLSMDGDSSSAWTAPMRQVLGTLESNMLALSMGAHATDLIAENEYRMGGKKSYTLEEHYGTLLGAIFNEVGKNQPIPPLRRDLQRFAIDGLMIQASAPAGGVNQDVKLITMDSLHRLDQRFVSALHAGTKLDELTRMHLRNAHEDISRFFSRQQVTTR